MYVEVVGDGERKLLVLPGWRLDSSTEKPDWLPVLRQRSSWRAFFVDLPGTGRSRQSEGVRTQRDMLKRLRVLLAEEDPRGDGWAVAGTSNGAALALGLARHEPARVHGLALRVPMLEADDDARTLEGQARWQAEFERLPLRFRIAHERKLAELWEPARQRTAAFLSTIRKDPARYALPDTREPFDFRSPTLVVTGRQDVQVGWQLAIEQLKGWPRATVAVLDGAGHALPAGASQRAVWRTLAADWLERVEVDWPTTTLVSHAGVRLGLRTERSGQQTPPSV